MYSAFKSIDAMIEKHECLPKILCDGNRQAQVIGHGFQYLMPVYRSENNFAIDYDYMNILQKYY